MTTRPFDQLIHHSPPSSEASDPSNTASSPQPQEHHPVSPGRYHHIATSLPPSLSSPANPKWTEKELPSMMNPCASSFIPKPTYADTVKATLPKPRAGNGQTKNPQHSSSNQAASQKKDLSRDGKQQVGFSIQHDRESPITSEAGGSKLGDPAEASPPDGPPNPTARGSCENTSASRPMLHNPRLRHLYKEQGLKPGAFQDADYHMRSQTSEDKASGDSPLMPDRGVFENPLHPAAFHYPPPMIHSSYYHDPGVYGYTSRPGSAYGMCGPFYPPPFMPYDVIPPPMRNHLAFFPPPLIPYPGPYAPGGYPIFHSHLGPSSPVPPDMPGAPGSDAGYTSRSSSRQASRRGRRSRAETRQSRESSRAKPRRTVEHHSRNPSGYSRIRPERVEPALRSEQPSESSTPDQSSLVPVASPQRDGAKYRIVSTTARSTQSGRNGRTEGMSGPDREAGSESNHSGLTYRSAENLGESHTRGFSSGQHTYDGRWATRKPQQTPLSHGISKPPNPDNEPPPNAPTGPASQRRLTNAARSQYSQTSLIHKPSEPGSWSQSKRWISQETKERAAFQKVMHTLHYMGADKSPFLPQTPSALTRFRVAEAERRSRKLTEELRRKVEELSRRKREEAAAREGDRQRYRLELFAGKVLSDGLSPVFAADSCFNTCSSSEPQVEWPSLAELKEEGDKRAARYGRYFPLPRLNAVATRILLAESGKTYNSDGSISWEKKAVKQFSRFIRPVSSEFEQGFSPPWQLQPDELHGALRTLLHDIDEMDPEHQREIHEEETEQVEGGTVDG